jgi:hypothetical protein
MSTGTRQQSAMQTRNTIFTVTAISDYPQSGERINWQAWRSHHPDKPSG